MNRFFFACVFFLTFRLPNHRNDRKCTIFVFLCLPVILCRSKGR